MRYVGAIIFLFVCSALVAQEEVQREKTFGEPVLFETHYIKNDKDSITVEALFRIREDIFVFSRPVESVTTKFSARGEIVIEILDSIGNSVARSIRDIELQSDDNSTLYLRTKFLQGEMLFKLAAGKYTALVQIGDNDSKRQFPAIKRPIKLEAKKSKIISSAIPVLTKQNADSSYECCNLNGDVNFSQNFTLVIATTPEITKKEIRYSLFRKKPSEDEKEIIVKDTAVTAAFFPSSSIQFKAKENKINLHVASGANSSIFFIPLNAITLPQGRYEIEINFADSTKLIVPFGTRWLDMPMSLTDIDIATYPLQYITTEDEYSELRSGGRETRINKFEAFWKKKDPTPATAYNEMMAEFYKRVDIAVTSYRTLKEMNGSLTDRGKILIQYGKPTSTERTLNLNNVPKEIWHYSSRNKTFIFEDPSRQGNYKLTDTK